MATTELTVQDVVRAGLNATYSAAASGDGNVYNNANKGTIVHVINGGGSPSVVTIETPEVVDTDLAIADRTVTVPAGEDRFLGPYTGVYEGNDADNNIERAVHLTFDQVTSVTVAVLRVP